jgi:hypothetical protein
MEFNMHFVPDNNFDNLAKIEIIMEKRMCDDRLAEEVADKIRNLFPDSLPIKERNLQRSLYLIHNRFNLFDKNNDGRLDIEEFISSEWAGLLISAPIGKCVITKDQFLTLYLGDPNDPLSGWHLSFQVHTITL